MPRFALALPVLALAMLVGGLLPVGAAAQPDHTAAATASRAKAFDVSNLLTTGAVAGLTVGFVFILANMIYATSQPALVDVPDGLKLPASAPLLDIGTVFYFDDMPQMIPAYPFAGLITHFSLSIVFGLIFALALVPLFSNARALLVGGVVYGGLLYIVNYQILGRLVFNGSTPPIRWVPIHGSACSPTSALAFCSCPSSSPWCRATARLPRRMPRQSECRSERLRCQQGDERLKPRHPSVMDCTRPRTVRRPLWPNG